MLAKLEEEEGGQDVAREQLRGAILVLKVHLSMPKRLVEGLVSIDTVTLVHRLAFSLPLCCQPREPSSATPHLARQPAIPRGSGWSQELSSHHNQHPLAMCTL